MARQRHNAAFIVGSVLGGVAGAAAALWTARQSGAELRAQVTERLGGSDPVRSTRDSAGTAGSGVGGKVLAFVENATAPIVGVKLGQTANQAASRASGAVGRVSDGVRRASGATDQPTSRTTAGATITSSSTGEPQAAGAGHVASTEELVTPTVPVEPRGNTEQAASFTKFPEFRDE